MRKLTILTLLIIVSIGLLNTATLAEQKNKVAIITEIQKEDMKNESLEKTLAYDEVASQMEYVKAIADVKKMRDQVLDMLGENKDCYVVGEQVHQLELLISRYGNHKGTKSADFEITRTKQLIETVKKRCPHYKKLQENNQ